MKTCRKCGVLFDDRGCKACAKVRKAKRYAADPEKAKSAMRKWQAMNAEKLKTYQAQRYSENAEKIKAAVAKWQADNPGVRRIHRQNRRARKLQHGGALSRGLADKLFMLQAGRCACCRVNMKKTGFHLDHVFPLKRGGKNEDENMQLLCPTCNQRKHAKDPVEFMQSMGFLI